MGTFAVALLAESREQLSAMQRFMEGITPARLVYSQEALPLAAADPIFHKLQQTRCDVAIVVISAQAPARAIQTIELLQAQLPELAVFAAGELSQPQVIVDAMRAGACEFLEASGGTAPLIEAFSRLRSARKRLNSSQQRGKIYTLVNAKGGCGATTIAVNTALALQEECGRVVLVDFALLGHSALHLNVRPSFGLLDALQNLERMDDALLEGFITQCAGGLHLLAAPGQPQSGELPPAELAHLFDVLVGRYAHVVVDCSNRIDSTVRRVCELSDSVLLVAQTDVASLWSAAKIKAALTDGNPDKIVLILNRFRKISGFSEGDAEAATNSRILWKIPNQFNAVAPAIDRGTPVLLQGGSEIARSFKSLAGLLVRPGGHLASSGLAVAEGYAKQPPEPAKRILDRLISLSPLASE